MHFVFWQIADNIFEIETTCFGARCMCSTWDVYCLDGFWWHISHKERANFKPWTSSVVAQRAVACLQWFSTPRDLGVDKFCRSSTNEGCQVCQVFRQHDVTWAPPTSLDSDKIYPDIQENHWKSPRVSWNDWLTSTNVLSVAPCVSRVHIRIGWGAPQGRGSHPSRCHCWHVQSYSQLFFRVGFTYGLGFDVFEFHTFGRAARNGTIATSSILQSATLSENSCSSYNDPIFAFSRKG